MYAFISCMNFKILEIGLSISFFKLRESLLVSMVILENIIYVGSNGV